MGDGEKAPLRVQFNPKVCLDFTALPSPQTPVSCPFENWMKPWA